MKRHYITPQIKACSIATTAILAVSDLTVDPSKDTPTMDAKGTYLDDEDYEEDF